MSKQETKKITKNEILELLEDNNFHSKMAMQKAGHVGLLTMACFIVIRETMKGREDKIAKTILLIAMIFLILDDVENIVYEGKKMMR